MQNQVSSTKFIINIKGKDNYTKQEIAELENLIKERCTAPQNEQKRIRNRMRKIGFYGREDWGITDCQVSDLVQLIKDGRIKVINSDHTAPHNIQETPSTARSEVASSSKITDIQFGEIDDLRRAGFEGFISVSDLWKDSSVIPDIKGVYMVVRTTDTAPVFLEKGKGGFFRGKNPNVSLDILHEKWVDDTCVVYIGQAGGIRNNKQPQSTLRSRLRQYLHFGQGKPVGHQGGCYIWQLEDAADLLFCWKPLPTDDPGKVETAFISAFKKHYGGQWPFANRED